MHDWTGRGRALAGALLVMALTVTACGGAPPAGESRSEVIIALDNEPRTMASPEGYAAETGQIIRQIQEPLVDRDQETGELIGILATDWEPVDDTTWRFTLREGVTFHDGTPFDAEAAAFAVNWNFSHETGEILRSFQGPAFEAVAVDEYTMDIVLEAPDPILPRRMVLGPLGSMAQITQDEQAWETAPIGTGPYRFVSWTRGDSAVVERYPDWWGNGADDADGDATIERATFVYRPEELSRANAVQTGEADVAPNLAAQLCVDTLVLDRNCFETDGLQMAHIRLDHMNPVLGDIRIREAMALAIDKELLGEELLPGEPASMMIPPGASGFAEDLQPYGFDMARATQLVQEAKSAGVPVDATPLTIVYERNKFPQGEAAGQYLLAQFQQIGLNVSFQALESAVLLEQLVEPDPLPGPERGWIAFHSHSNRMGYYASTVEAWVLCDGPISTYCNPEVDRLYDIAAPIPEGPERNAALQDLARVVHADYANIPLVYLNVNHGLTDRVTWDFRADTLPYLKNMRIN